MIRTTQLAPSATLHSLTLNTAPASTVDRVALNPQPLPPRDLFSQVRRTLDRVAPASYSPTPGSDRGIIVVGGRTFLPGLGANRGIIIVGG
jgi:hypothetical protein